MAEHRQRIGTRMKRKLRAEAGEKCANPGCPNYRTHIHHIREWAVYQSNDERHMIAVCPACHDAIHNGELHVDDTTLYQWKKIDRRGLPIRGHLYIEPSTMHKVLLGGLAVNTTKEATIFHFSPDNYLKYKIQAADVPLLDLCVTTEHGVKLLHVENNHILHAPIPEVQCLRRPGQICVTVAGKAMYLPEWAIRLMQIEEPSYAAQGEVTAAAVTTISPGVAKIEAAWAQSDRAIVITKRGVSFLSPRFQRPLSIIGKNENCGLYYAPQAGDVPLFGFDDNSHLKIRL